MCAYMMDGYGMFHRWNTSKSRWELLNLVRGTFLVWSLKTSVGWVSQGLLCITQVSNLEHRNVSNLMISWLISGVSILSYVPCLFKMMRARCGIKGFYPSQVLRVSSRPYLGSVGSTNISNVIMCSFCRTKISRNIQRLGIVVDILLT